jgi:hypothetical protein
LTKAVLFRPRDKVSDSVPPTRNSDFILVNHNLPRGGPTTDVTKVLSVSPSIR